MSSNEHPQLVYHQTTYEQGEREDGTRIPNLQATIRALVFANLDTEGTSRSISISSDLIELETILAESDRGISTGLNDALRNLGKDFGLGDKVILKTLGGPEVIDTGVNTYSRPHDDRYQRRTIEVRQGISAMGLFRLLRMMRPDMKV